MSICNVCQMNSIPSGCGVAIRHLEVKKGVGVVSCIYFLGLNEDPKKAQRIKNELISKRFR
ncbi:hypothetical protein KDN24_06755 [Bacillus sp. Bva_UNVM-123]|uniref:hypothetical protein n=1 Tax=Bacillus sp. Bva_UNVM-123 TaxID=2829798 RepID=UPI00391F5BC7